MTEAVTTLPAFPFRVRTPGEALDEYSKLRAQAAVTRVQLPGGHEGWLVLRHAEVRTVLTDLRFSKEAMTRPDAPRLIPVHRGSRSLVNLDPPDHTRLRKLASREFTQRRVETLRPRIEEITADLVDTMLAAGSQADAVTALALPLPITVICELLGVEPEEQARFRQWGDKVLTVGGPGADADAAREAAGALMGYLTGLIERKRARPGEDLLTRLLQAQEDGDSLDAEELRTLAMTILIAGYHTTVSAASHLLVHLLEDPARYQSLVDDPELITTAVEEALRYSQVAGGFGSMRIALEDVELGGVTIRAGEPVIPLINSANRDESAFAEADELQLDRTDNPHLAFGAGIHFCLGAALARLELRVLLETLVARRIPLALGTPVDELRWHLATAFPRPAELPIQW
ncbi:cytochrome P450 [Amycolatopsis sp. NPDC051758]|uniref:cytochrome P450 n=1 Tax=Amycolatopsis sp. NPDC051758 TaxID=3363935 RepID=UPI0037B80084